MDAQQRAEQAHWLSVDALEALSGGLAAETRRAYFARLRAVKARLENGLLTDLSLSEMLADLAYEGLSPSTLAQTAAASAIRRSSAEQA